MVLSKAIFVILLASAVTAAAASDLIPLSDDFIDSVNSQQTTWRAGRNFPHNTPLKYLKKLLGFIPNNEGPKLPIIKHDAKLKDSLPKSFDARENWPNCSSIGEIRDQGSCGSCWAFSAVETMTDRVCIFSKGITNFNFSAEDLVDCGKENGINGCHGGNPLIAFDYWINHGIVSGGNYNSSQGCKPYTTPPCVHHAPNQVINVTADTLPCLNSYIDTPKCSKTCIIGYETAYESDKMFGKNALRINNDVKDIMAEIYLNGPVVAGLAVYRDFYTYKSGIYQHVVEERLGWHAVKVIGWGAENGTEYWLVANSWNSYWGDKGFLKIIKGQNECFIETFIMAGEPLLPDE